MKAKTKTAALIAQKQLFKTQQQNQPNSSTVPKKQPQHTRIPHLQFSKTDQISYTPPLPSSSPKLSLSKQSNNYSQLQRQNFRLIESNYNLLLRHATILEKIREDLQKVIIFIQQYHYVEGIKTVYEILDKIKYFKDIRNQGSPGYEKVEEENENRRSAKFIKVESVVEEYRPLQIKQTFKQIHPQKPSSPILKKLQLISNTIEQQYEPEKPYIFDEPDLDSSGHTPQFRKKMRQNYQLLWSNEQIDMNQPIQSCKSIPIRYKQASHSFLTPLSQQNLKFFTNKKNIHRPEQPPPNYNPNQDLYKVLLTQAVSLQSIFLRDNFF